MYTPNFLTSSYMIYCFDLDGTICSSVEDSQYELAIPDNVVIGEINRLYDRGDKIKIMTARGCVSKIDHSEITEFQLNKWGVKYHELILNVKPHAHLFIDDKGINIKEWKNQIPNIRGIIAGAFDLIHPGYIRAFKEAKMSCNHLTIALHDNPTLERSYKLSPVNSIDERIEILESIKYIDDIIIYRTESELLSLISSGNFDVRFLGEDYKNIKYTGIDIPIKVIFVSRTHNYSTTELKNKISNSLKI